MSFRIGDLSLKELKELLIQIEGQIKTLEKKTAPKVKRTASAAKGSHAALPMVREIEVSSQAEAGQSGDLVKAGLSAEARKSSAIKYMHPANRDLCWDGVGVEPEWIGVYLERGGSFAALENTAERFRSSLRVRSKNL